MPEEHYFSASPQAKLQTHEVSFEVAGEQLSLLAASGTFSSSRLDPGTAILLKQLPDRGFAGPVLDIGCGWGPIAVTLARVSPEATVYALDVNQRSLELTQANADRLGLGNVQPVTAEQVPEGLEFSAIWSNPPIRIGKAKLHELLLTWLPRLAPGATALLVVAKHLGADSLLRWLGENLPGFEVVRRDSSKGYRIIAVTRPTD